MSDPHFTMSKYASTESLYKEKAQYYQKKSETLEERISWALRCERSGMVGFVGDLLRGRGVLDVSIGSYTLREFIEATERDLPPAEDAEG